MGNLDSSERIANLLGATALAVMDRVYRDLAALGFSEAEAATLATLHANPGLRIRDLAEVLRRSHPGTARLVARLHDRGLVKKAKGRDRREETLHLTKSGKRAVAGIFAERQRLLTSMLESVPEELRSHLRASLEALLTATAHSDLETYRICRLCNESDCNLDTCPVERNDTGQWP